MNKRKRFFALLLCGISMGVMGKFVFVSGGKE